MGGLPAHAFIKEDNSKQKRNPATYKMNFLVIIVCSTLPLSMVKKRSVLGFLTRVNEAV